MKELYRGHMRPCLKVSSKVEPNEHNYNLHTAVEKVKRTQQFTIVWNVEKFLNWKKWSMNKSLFYIHYPENMMDSLKMINRRCLNYWINAKEKSLGKKRLWHLSTALGFICIILFMFWSIFQMRKLEVFFLSVFQRKGKRIPIQRNF